MSEKQTWFVIDRFYISPYPELKQITVLNETQFTITVEEEMFGRKRTVRRKKDGNMFRTKAEAEAEITRRLTQDVKNAEEDLEKAKKAFQKWFVRP